MSEHEQEIGPAGGSPVMAEARYGVRPVGIVRSSLRSREDCPRQGREGAPDAWLEIDPAYGDALDGLLAGSDILILTWLHESRRDLLRVHPRGDPNRPLRGVFATRSPVRPNPIGLHRATIVKIEGPGRIRVRPLEVLDGTPIIDIKPVMEEVEER
jgi:tRNA-Thr(GGU) m(6)t(6)A37 methyltransferase TsaA